MDQALLSPNCACNWVIQKSGDKGGGARTANFGIIGHQMRNWE